MAQNHIDEHAHRGQYLHGEPDPLKVVIQIKLGLPVLRTFFLLEVPGCGVIPPIGLFNLLTGVSNIALVPIPNCPAILEGIKEST